MRRIRERVCTICLLAVGIVTAQRSVGPQPAVVDPGGAGKAPSDAVVLFNGRDNTGWTRLDGTPSRCTVADGVMTCRTGALDTASTEKFRDAQIHVEFNVPYEPDQKGYARANSGIILQNLYEIQILDSYRNATAPDSSCASLYRQSAPLVNACRPPGEWQSFDIIFHAPVCASDGAIQTPGSLTLLHNGVLQDHSRVVGRTIEIEEGPINGPAPDTTMRFRNIWMRRLSQ